MLLENHLESPPVADPVLLRTGLGVKPVKLLCFIPHLGGGGAEMHLVRLLNHFDRTEFQLSLAVARDGGCYESRLPNVPVNQCGWQRLPSSTLRMLTATIPLRRLIERERPDVVLTFLDHAVAAAARALKGVSEPRPVFIAGIQNNLAKTLQHLPRWTRQWLGRDILSAYAQADHVVALSVGAADTLAKLVPDLKGRMSVVSNAGYDKEVEMLSREQPPLPIPTGNWFLGCGRLTVQKDFSTLLRAFACIKDDIEGKLWILGEGEQRAKLERQIVALGLSGRVRLPGFVKNPFAFMARATTFVLSSQWEGFANVVTEAMACGTPIISTNCPYGPREILEDGRWGELVPVGDVAALARAMRFSVRDRKRFRARADAAREYVARFEATWITRQYEAMIRAVLSVSKGTTDNGRVEAKASLPARWKGCATRASHHHES